MSSCIYVRKSRADIEAENRGEGETLSRHIKTLQELADKKQIKIDKIYKEIVSGETIAARPQMQALLSDIEQGVWDSVFVMEVERLARGDTIDQGIVAQTFKYAGTKIITPVKEYNPLNEFDEEYFEFGLFMSRREYKTINRRLQAGRIASVKEGKYVGNIAPYGYDRKKLENDKGFTLVPNEKEAPVIKLIFDLYVNGEISDGEYIQHGTGTIANKLNSLNIKSRKSIKWSDSSIRDIIKNPAYDGKVRWDRRKSVKNMVSGNIKISRPLNNDCTIIDGLHQPLISHDIFLKAQEKINSNMRKPRCNKNMSLKNPLSGLVVCAECGHKLVRKHSKKEKTKDALVCPYPYCSCSSISLEILEKKIIESLKEYANNLTVEINHTFDDGKVDIKEKLLCQLNDDLKNKNTQLNKIYELLENGVYSTDVFIDRSTKIKNEIKDIKTSIKKLEVEILKIKEFSKNKSEYLPKVINVIDSYYNLESATAKNQLLREIIEKVEYYRPSASRWGDKNNFEITIFPKIPSQSHFK